MNQQEIEVSNKADKIVHKVEKKMDAKNVACFAEMQGQDDLYVYESFGCSGYCKKASRKKVNK